MILSAHIKGPKAQHLIARGEAPGNRAEDSQALKGRNNISSRWVLVPICVALKGLDVFVELILGASSRAATLRPCRAGEGMVYA